VFVTPHWVVGVTGPGSSGCPGARGIGRVVVAVEDGRDPTRLPSQGLLSGGPLSGGLAAPGGGRVHPITGLRRWLFGTAPWGTNNDPSGTADPSSRFLNLT